MTAEGVVERLLEAALAVFAAGGPADLPASGDRAGVRRLREAGEEREVRAGRVAAVAGRPLGQNGGTLSLVPQGNGLAGTLSAEENEALGMWLY